MRSLQDYIDIYKTVAKNLNLQGDSVEVLVQMLANATFISEVENISYVQEASLEKATLMNSKIQHCMNEMYSVYRGSCPRVIIKFKPTKYFSFSIFDEIISSNTFKVYYLGYYTENSSDSENEDQEGTKAVAGLEGFTYSPITIPPSINDETFTIIGLLSKEVVEQSWTLDQSNTYYVDCLEENLSNDMWVKINSEYFDVTREFSSHILNADVFDLTLPSFGSRLYVADIFRSEFNRVEDQTPSNTKIDAMYFKLSELSEYNESELKRLSMKGAENVSFDSKFLAERGLVELSPGISYINETPRDSVNTVHYKANRDRYVNSILRSNSDVGVVLEEMYPEKIYPGGTSYDFLISSENSMINIYYVPYSRSNLLTDLEIQRFISERSSYYVTDLINVQKGLQYVAIFNIDIEIYQSTNIDNEVKEILDSYGNKFEINLQEKIEEIKSLISKISNVKKIIDIGIIYTSEDGSQLDQESVSMINPKNSYYQINYVINSIIQTKG